MEEGKVISRLWGGNITWKEGNEKKHPLPFNIKAAGKNAKLGRGEGEGKIWGRKSCCRELYKALKVNKEQVGYLDT